MKQIVRLALGALLICGASSGQAAEYALTFKKGLLSIAAGTGTQGEVVTNRLGRTVEARTLAFQASPFVERFYHLKTRVTSYLLPDGRSFAYEKESEEGDRVYTEEATFTYSPTGSCTVVSRRAVRGRPVEHGRAERAGAIYDLASLCACARRRVSAGGFTKGQRLGVSVASGVRVRDRELVYEGVETEKTEKGRKIACHVFRVEGREAEDKGKVSARFWIAQKVPQVVVLIELELKFGRVQIRLAE